MAKNKQLTLMQEFNIAVYNSVSYKKDLSNIGNYKYYYDKTYENMIKKFLSEKNVKSMETRKGSLRSTSSSARLCTNYFYEDSCKYSFEFEKPLRNDVASTPTKMDAVDGLIFYECKCQEIVNGEHELLRKSYHTKISSKLFKEFRVNNVEIKPHYNKDGNHDYDYCDFSLKDLDIDYPGNYYDINFNVKQLLCHLIAIANSTSDSECKTLEYIVFKPQKNLITKSEKLTQLYENLDAQFNAILNSKKIQEFISPKHHNIHLTLKYVYIDEVPEHFKI